VVKLDGIRFAVLIHINFTTARADYRISNSSIDRAGRYMSVTDQYARMTADPGHKTSQHLIEGEAYRRIMSGEMPATFDEFAQQLLEWLRATYPGASPVTLEIVESWISHTWHRRHDMIRGG
jgi:hypothetical protein